MCPLNDESPEKYLKEKESIGSMAYTDSIFFFLTFVLIVKSND